MTDSILSRLERFKSLRFNSENDALSHARQITQDARKAYMTKYANVIERYIRGDAELHLSGRWRETENFTLVSRGVPNGLDCREEKPTLGLRDSETINLKIHHQNVLVLGWIRELAKEGQQIIPACVSLSFGVWSQLQEIRTNLVWDTAPRPPFTGKLLLESHLPALRIPEREIGMLHASAAQNLGRSMDGLVQSSTDFAQKAHRVSFDIIGDVKNDPDFVNQIPRIWVALGSRFQVVSIDEPLSEILKIINVSVQTSEGQLGTVKRIEMSAHLEGDR